MEDKACDTSHLQDFIEECQRNGRMDEDEPPLGHSSPILPPQAEDTAPTHTPKPPTQPRPNLSGSSGRSTGAADARTASSKHDDDKTSSKPQTSKPTRSGKSRDKQPGMKRQSSKDTLNSDGTNLSDELAEMKSRGVNKTKTSADKKGRRASVMQSPDLDSNGLKVVDNSSQGMTSIPAHILTDKAIGVLMVTGNNLRTVPSDIRKMKQLYKLDLSKNAIRCVNEKDYSGLPDSLTHLTRLTHLHLSECNLAYVPAVIWSLVSLEYLDLSRNKIGVLLPEVGNLRNLRRLNLQQTNISALPQEIVFCQQLEEIHLFGNKMESLPDTLPELPKLRVMTVNYRSFSSVVDPYTDNLLIKGQIRSEFIPIVVFEMPAIETLDLEATKINCLPEMFTGNLVELCIAANYLQTFPETLFHISHLQTLDVSHNSIGKLPENIGTMSNLVELKLNKNGFVAIPTGIGLLRNLVSLEMGGNNVRVIPAEINQLTKLKCLILDQNHIQALPEEMCGLTELETLDLSENCLKTLPLNLGRLTKLTVAHSYRGTRKCGLWLYKNNLIEPPADVWKTVKTHKIFTYLQQLKLRKMEDVNRQKLFILGDSGAGKTSLVNSLVRGKGEFYKGKTRLLTYTPWTTFNKVKLLVMDFAGSSSYGPARSLFLDANGLVLIVFDHTKLTESNYDDLIGQWVELVLLYMPGSVIKLVVSHSDIQVDLMDARMEGIREKVRQHLGEYAATMSNYQQQVCDDLHKINAGLNNDDVRNIQLRLELQRQQARLEFLVSNVPVLMDEVSVVSTVDGLRANVVELMHEIEDLAINETYFRHARDKPPKSHEAVSAALKKQRKLFVINGGTLRSVQGLDKISETDFKSSLEYLHRTGEMIVKQIERDEIVLPRPRGLVDVVWSLYRDDMHEYLSYDDNRLFSCRGDMTREEFQIARDKYLRRGLVSWPMLKCIWFHHDLSLQQTDHFISVMSELNLCFEIPQPDFPKGPNFAFPILSIAHFNADLHTDTSDSLQPRFDPIAARELQLNFIFPRRFSLHIFESIASRIQSFVTKRFDWSKRVEALLDDTKITIEKREKENDNIVVTVQGETIADVHKTLAALYPLILRLLLNIRGLVWRVDKTSRGCEGCSFQQCFPNEIFLVSLD